MSKVRENIIFLFLIQGINYLFPLLTIPYFARIFGPTGVGVLALAQVVILYLVAVVDFGFNLTVTRRISIAYERKDYNEINRLFTHTIAIKICIFVLVSFFIIFLCQSVPKLFEVKNLIYIGFISLFGTVINPIWLFQGIQKMSILLVPTALSKIISITLIFLFVKDMEDMNLAMFFTSLSMLIVGFVSLYFVYKMELASITRLNIIKIKKMFKESFFVFLTYLGSSIYTTMNLFLMSFYIGFKEIGIYSSADKIVSTANSLMSPIHQAIFPNLSNFKDVKEYINKIKKYGLILFIISLLITLLLFFGSNLIVRLLFGIGFEDSSSILKILSILPVIICFGILFGQWGLLVIGESKILGIIYTLGGFLHLSYVFIFLHFWGIYGGAYSIVITETVISITLFICFLKKIKQLRLNHLIDLE